MCASKDGAGSVYPSVPPQAVRHGLAEREHAPRRQRPPLCAEQACDHSRQPAVVCPAGLAWPGLAAHLLLLHLADVCRRVNRHLIGRIGLIGQARPRMSSALATPSRSRFRFCTRAAWSGAVTAYDRNGGCAELEASRPPFETSHCEHTQPQRRRRASATKQQRQQCRRNLAAMKRNMQQTAYRKQHAVHKHTTTCNKQPTGSNMRCTNTQHLRSLCHPTCTMLQASMQCTWRLS